MKVAVLIILAALALAIFTGACDVEVSTFTPGGSEQTTTSALTSNQLPPPDPPSAAIKPWGAGSCMDCRHLWRGEELEHKLGNSRPRAGAARRQRGQP